MRSSEVHARRYPRQDQTCFVDRHVRALAHFGAAPHRLAYDSLKAGVRKILVGSDAPSRFARKPDRAKRTRAARTRFEGILAAGDRACHS